MLEARSLLVPQVRWVILPDACIRHRPQVSEHMLLLGRNHVMHQVTDRSLTDDPAASRVSQGIVDLHTNRLTCSLSADETSLCRHDGPYAAVTQ